jgi:hypothetical protein
MISNPNAPDWLLDPSSTGDPMLDDLERAIDRCEEAGETLANLAIKHG